MRRGKLACCREPAVLKYDGDVKWLDIGWVEPCMVCGSIIIYDGARGRLGISYRMRAVVVKWLHRVVDMHISGGVPETYRGGGKHEEASLLIQRVVYDIDFLFEECNTVLVAAIDGVGGNASFLLRVLVQTRMKGTRLTY